MAVTYFVLLSSSSPTYGLHQGHIVKPWNLGVLDRLSGQLLTQI